MFDPFARFIPVVALFAYIVKGATGFGPALIFVSIGSLLIGPQKAIVLSAMLDIIAGFYLLYLDPIKTGHRFWLPMALTMVCGAVTGGLLLSIIPKQNINLLLGIIIFGFGLWFVFIRNHAEGELQPSLPSSCSKTDLAIFFIAGLSDGLFGISGPLIIFYLGRRFAKDVMRRTLVIIFLITAIARIITYAATGMIGTAGLLLGLFSIPCLFAGIYIGNHLFFKLSEVWFSRVAGTVLILISLRLIF